MKGKSKSSIIAKFFLGLGILSLALFALYEQKRFSFMLQDLSYMQNLSTMGELNSLKDVFQSIGAGYRNYSGGAITGFLLQLILLAGEKFADVFNILLLLGTAFLIERVIGAKHQRFLFVALPMFLLISINSDWRSSYFLEYGIIQFFLPALGILSLLCLYGHALDDPKSEYSHLYTLSAAAFGFFTGFSNGGYGVVALILPAFSIVLYRKLLGRKIPLWMYVGEGAVLLGTVFWFAAPGNYADTTMVKDLVIQAAVFPAVVLALVMLAILLRAGGWLQCSQILMLGVLAWSVLIRFVGGAIPAFEINGVRICVIVLGVTLFSSLLYHMNLAHKEHRRFGFMVAVISYVYVLLQFLEDYLGVM